MIATLTNVFTNKLDSKKSLDSIDFFNVQSANFLQDVIEGLHDGILILSHTGELLYANASGYDICCQLNQFEYSAVIPPNIWKICRSMMEDRCYFSDLETISDEVVLNKSIAFRFRVSKLSLKFDINCFLVTIENKYESLSNYVFSEIKKYRLTARQAEIWHLYRANYTYKEIATQLYISINTVKKHMKNIHAKRQLFIDL